MEERIAVVSDAVIYHDTTGTPHNALITDGNLTSAVGWRNVVFVSDDETKKDNYGRQIERELSVSHVSGTTAWGRYWRWPDEQPNSR